jgi:serine/threonine protein kinase
VSFTGDVKIVDFGIAKSGTQPGEDTANGPAQGQGPVHVAGAGLGQAIDWRSDIFAVGVMLFELTTGQAPLQGRERVRDA